MINFSVYWNTLADVETYVKNAFQNEDGIGRREHNLSGDTAVAEVCRLGDIYAAVRGNCC